ncbi:MAG: family flavoprotein [Herminiimonas sp.]|nr:family flavoprotein [Herminiimonas sp.]
MKPIGATSPVVVIGAGPAGLMAAETLAQRGYQVDVYDAMASVGRKFLLAGKGGMNLTHAEPLSRFMDRYGARRAEITPWINAFGPQALRDWAADLGVQTFVGSSGRVFPTDMKAAPLLRAWLHRLRAMGVRFHMRHRWIGWDEAAPDAPEQDLPASPPALRLATPQGDITLHPSAVVLALGGASWPRLGSDGAWVALLRQKALDVTPLRPANCGFDVAWSAHFRDRFSGHPVKSVALRTGPEEQGRPPRPGEFMITDGGIEGSLVYAVSAELRDEIEVQGSALVHIDLLPGKDAQRVLAEVAHPRGSRSMSSHLQSRVGLTGVKAGLLRELADATDYADATRLAARIKNLPLTLLSPRPIAEAISTAGGVTLDSLNANLMTRTLPGMFFAGGDAGLGSADRGLLADRLF